MRRADPLAPILDRARASLLTEFLPTDIKPAEVTAAHLIPQPVGKVAFHYRHGRSLWAEQHTIRTVNQDGSLVAVAFGASCTDLELTGWTQAQYDAIIASTDTLGKRPDVLVFRRADYEYLRLKYPVDGDRSRPLIDNLMLTPDAELLKTPEIVRLALRGVEVKQSNLEVAGCEDYGKPSETLRCCKGLERYRGVAFSKSAKIPHIFLSVKEMERLREWSDHWEVPLLVSQFCLDAAFLADFQVLERAVKDKVIMAVDKATGRPPKKGKARDTAELEYRFWYSLAVVFGIQVAPTEIIPFAQRCLGGTMPTSSRIQNGEWCLHDDAVWLLHLGGGA